MSRDVDSDSQIGIAGLQFVQTCRAIPEQYDVFKGRRRVGYVRIRSGRFRVDCPNCGDETVLERVFPRSRHTLDANEDWVDIIQNDRPVDWTSAERRKLLNEAARAILAWMQRERSR